MQEMSVSKPCIVIHHGGTWQTTPSMCYVGGEVNIYDNIPDDVDYVYVRKLVDKLDYTNIVKLHYLDPRMNFQTGLRFLGSNETFEAFLGFLIEYGEVHLFCEHDNEFAELNVNIPFLDLLKRVDAPNTTSPSMIIEDIDYDEEGSDNEDEEVLNTRDEMRLEKTQQIDYKDEIKGLMRLEGWSKDQLNGTDSDYEDESDLSDLESPNESSDEDNIGYLVNPQSSKKARVTNFSYMSKSAPQDTTFCKGQLFNNAAEFRKALTNYCVSSGKDVVYTKNHKDKIGANCKTHGCPWRIWASWAGKSKTFQVKTYIGEHKCGRLNVVSKISASWIAENYKNKFKINPYLKLQEIVDTIWREWGINVSIFMAGKARKKAQLSVVGEYREQYSLLHRYAAEILRANINNTIKFSLDNGVFKRVYICFSALKLGFLEGCRPFISIDGCFLKGPFGGQLLVAVGKDGNNQIFLIAWAVVEVENTESWSWFMGLLAADLGTTNGSGYTIMSDQQKGLLKAVSDVWPQAEVRCCARHVYMNFREVFGGGKDYRRGFWAIAKSTTENEFRENIEKFRLISNDGADDLLKRNYQKWCRAFYTPQSQCDNVDNNMSEVFNAYILKCRHKPIISMLEEIRESLMERLHMKRDMIEKKDIFLCPRIKDKLEKAKINARGWSAFWDGRFSYGIKDGATQVKYVVDLRQKTCSCRSWQLNGVPCRHAVAAIWKNVEHPEHYVAQCYHKVGYLKAYQFNMEPLNGPQEWPLSEYQQISPPPLKKLRAGRPVTKRRMQHGERSSGKLAKSGAVMRCSICHEPGHNKRKCDKNQSLSTPTVATIPPMINVTSNQVRHTLRKDTNSRTSNEGLQQPRPPMHHRGYGMYTYPSGFTRTATMMQPRRMAYYTDNEGQQTIRSMTAINDIAPDMISQTSTQLNKVPASFFDTNGRRCITSQGLQDFAHNRSR